MIKASQLHIHIKWLTTNNCLMYATDQYKNNMATEEWLPHVFTWHEASFYGTTLEKINKDGVVGIVLSPWQALDYFSTATSSTLMQILWDENGQWLRAHAKQLKQQIENKRILPDFEQWKKGDIGWTIANIDGSSAPHFTKTLISAAIEEWLQLNPKTKRTFMKQLKRLSLIQDEGLFKEFMDETYWLKKMEIDKEIPFTISLKLDEPEKEQDHWPLSLILTNKENNNDTLEIKPNFFDQLPINWKKQAYLDYILTEQAWITAVVPWLENAEMPRTCKQQLTENEAWLFLTKASDELEKVGINTVLPSWWEKMKDHTPTIKMQVQTEQDFTQPSFVGLNTLVNFNWKIATKEFELSEDEFKQLVREQKHLIQKNGKWMKLDPTFINYLKTLMKKVKNEDVTLGNILAEDAFDHAESNVTIELDDQLQTLMNKLSKIDHIPKVKISNNLKAELRPYQKQGVEWLLFLRKFHFGACLADDMGLGKTIQTITYFLQVKETEQPKNPALIICPTSVLGNWQKEINRFAPSLSTYLHYGSKRKKRENFHQYDLVLTSYSLAQLDQDELTKQHWDTICLDEAQNIKNAQTKQAKAIRSMKANHKIALTGTPIENRLSELWSIFAFLNPGYLRSLEHFRKNYIQPIEKDKDAEKIQKVKRLIQPFLLRRTKQDEEVALNLPEKQEQKEYVPLTVEQASLYEHLVQDTLTKLQQTSGIKRRGMILSMLTKLKQICNHPALYLRDTELATDQLVTGSHKLEKLMELVGDIKGQNESCLIFTQYIEMGQMMKKVLEEELAEQVLFLHGGVNKEQRDQMIYDFQEKNKNILILSLRAGGTGLNLTAANHVIHYDRWWNPAVENQATDRAYRIGQNRFVHVHKLITTGTLEEHIDEMIESKKALSEEIISGDHWITELSEVELEELVELRG